MLYYVSDQAIESGDGSLANPFRTLEEATAVVKEGDQIMVRPGSYTFHISEDLLLSAGVAGHFGIPVSAKTTSDSAKDEKRPPFRNGNSIDQFGTNLEVEVLHSDLMLTGCDAISFPFEASLFLVKSIFVRGDIIWFSELYTGRLIELDSAYGIYRKIPAWTMTSMQSIDLTMDANLAGLARTTCTLLTILSKSSAKNPEVTCDSLNNQVNPHLKKIGITMRMTPKNLKFIQDKKFYPLEEVLYQVNTAPIELVNEVFSNETK